MRRVGIERLAVVEIGAGAVMAEIAGGIDIRDAMEAPRADSEGAAIPLPEWRFHEHQHQPGDGYGDKESQNGLESRQVAHQYVLREHEDGPMDEIKRVADAADPSGRPVPQQNAQTRLAAVD